MNRKESVYQGDWVCSMEDGAARFDVRTAILSIVIFLSGASALLFQTLWLRLSGLVFGNSVWAAALILSSFMAGLALGSAFAASITLRRLRPIRLYAALEIVVALLGCTLVFGLPSLGQLLRPIFQSLWNHQEVLNVVRFSISFLLLLIPTTAMGLCLPVLLADPILKDREFRNTVGTLYGWNTLGAVVGALIGELYLIRTCGLFGTGLTASGISCAAAGLAFLGADARPKIVSHTAKPLTRDISPDWRTPWRLLLVSMGSGAILLGLEVIWFRFMRLYVASTSTAFCIMLAVVLGGIGFGSIASTLVGGRFASPRRLLPFLLILAGSATLLSYWLFPVPFLTDKTSAFHLEAWPQIAQLSLALMFPVAFISGITFPAILASVQREIGNHMNSAGLAILFNTTGAALGSLLACFILLPHLGFQSSLVLLAGCYGALALLACEKQMWSFRRPRGLAWTVAFATLILLMLAFPYHRDEKHFATARLPYEVDDSHLVRRIEGTADTFQLLRRDLFGQPYYFRLVTNAYSMSGTLPRSQRYMRLFAYLPLALQPKAEDALLICYGLGVTADAFIHDPKLKHLDAVDISKEVFDLADNYSGPGQPNPLRDSRVTTFRQDGRFFLQASPRSYDIITGEPPPLKVAGTVNLYTQEFFSLMRDRLRDGGVATFWLPIYQLTTGETKAILRAFYNAFPNASVWATNDLEWIMTGMKGPLRKPDEKSVDALWSDAGIRSDLRRIGIEVPAQMSALFLMDSAEIDRITQGVAPLSDLFPQRLTDTHPDLEAAHRFAFPYFEYSAALRRFRSSAFIAGIWPRGWEESLELLFFIRERRYLAEISGSNWMADLDFYLRHTRLRTPVLAVQNSDEFRLTLAEQATRIQPSETLPDFLAGALARRDLGGAIQLLESDRERSFTNINNVFLLTYLYCLNGNVDKAEALAASKKSSIQKDWFVDALWGDLQAEFGFRPPR